MTNSSSAGSVSTCSAVSSVAKPERVVAIDALRGFDMLWIVGGRELFLAVVAVFGAPAPTGLTDQFRHSIWEGFTFWDLIMPLFLFIVGAAMPFSFARRIEQGQPRRQLYGKLLWRTFALFVIGMALQGNLLDFNLATLHPFSNTLQAIAVGYLFAGLILLHVGVWGQWMATFALLALYGLLLAWVPLAEHGTGVFEPHVNVAFAVDQIVLGRFLDGTDPPYTWVLSGLGFAASVMLGVLAGQVLRSRASAERKLGYLAATGTICLAAGWAWSNWLGLPIIKHIWTSSMVLWAGGWSILLLALFYLLIDVLEIKRWAFPLVVVGANAITIYVAWKFIPFPAIAKTLVGGLASHLGKGGAVLVAFTSIALWWIVLYDFYRRKVFWRL
ncbi:MAG: DUF5009 domain-containing protein [Pirellulales bacterium]|nr:DUF5009 domain-containing protein [Pirellulales bacterium]